VIAAAKAMPLLVLVLASKTGWPEAGIHAMSLRRLLRYLKEIKPESS